MAVYSLGQMGLSLDGGLPAVRDTLFSVGLTVLTESLTANGSRVVMQQVRRALPSPPAWKRASLGYPGGPGGQRCAEPYYLPLARPPWKHVPAAVSSFRLPEPPRLTIQ